jgi:hypothetical protein
MRWLALVLCVVVAVLSDGCGSDNPCGPEGDSGFYLGITVVDRLGQPVPGLRVSEWNRLSGLVDTGRFETAASGISDVVESHSGHGYGSRRGDRGASWLSRNIPNPFTDATRTAISVPDSTHASVRVYALDGAIVETPLDEDFPWGVSAWVPFGDSCAQSTGGTRVFLFEFTATGISSGDTLIRESAAAVMHRPSVRSSVIGVTSDEGQFGTDDRLLFPHLFDLPVLHQVADDGVFDPISEFSISDTVVIALSDTCIPPRAVATYERVIRDCRNSFTLLWDLESPAGSDLTSEDASRGHTRAGKPN